MEEKIYDLETGQDPEEVIAGMLKMSHEYVRDNEAALIFKYPNTYTFTKSMAERVMKKNRGSLNLAIVRPSIVISAIEEPV